jgi:hypothetical protein
MDLAWALNRTTGLMPARQVMLQHMKYADFCSPHGTPNFRLPIDALLELLHRPLSPAAASGVVPVGGSQKQQQQKSGGLLINIAFYYLFICSLFIFILKFLFFKNNHFKK